jgi:hypothetical protein
MSEARNERLAENEVLFRSLNEAIEDVATTLGDDAPYDFICECASVDCVERLSLTLQEYERVRANGAHFLVAPGHEDEEVELVVAVHDEYVVVEKEGLARLAAQIEDPRG